MVCSIEGCNDSVKARGWCSKHWTRWKVHGDPNVTMRPTYGKGKDPVLAKGARQRYRERNRETLREKGRAYSKANQEKSRDWKRRDKAAHPRKYREDNRRYYESHKAEAIERGRAWRHKNPERARENVRRRRAKVVGRFRIPRTWWNELLGVYGNCCAYCLRPAKLEPDHVIAVAEGGLHVGSNIVPACVRCNRSKCDRPVLFWFAER